MFQSRDRIAVETESIESFTDRLIIGAATIKYLQHDNCQPNLPQNVRAGLDSEDATTTIVADCRTCDTKLTFNTVEESWIIS